MQSMADFLVAHLGHGDTPAECTSEAESLRSSAARSAHYAAAFTHSLGERIVCALRLLCCVSAQQVVQLCVGWKRFNLVPYPSKIRSAHRADPAVQPMSMS